VLLLNCCVLSFVHDQPARWPCSWQQPTSDLICQPTRRASTIPAGDNGLLPQNPSITGQHSPPLSLPHTHTSKHRQVPHRCSPRSDCAPYAHSVAPQPSHVKATQSQAGAAAAIGWRHACSHGTRHNTTSRCCDSSASIRGSCRVSSRPRWRER